MRGPVPIDLTGRQFTRLTVIGFDRKDGKHRRWWCRCACGRELSVVQDALTAGRNKSCGCYRSDTTGTRFTTHGKARSSEYGSWCAMKARCSNPRTKQYRDYGGRGIVVCPEWTESFEQFFADMGPRPTRQHSLDRIDNDGPYTPSNCRWAIATEQRRNTRVTKMVTWDGRTRCLKDWSAELGIPRATLFYRLKKGVPVAEAFKH